MTVGTSDGILAVRETDLTVVDARWSWADERRSAISENFARRQLENPAFFNGRIFVLAEHKVEQGRLVARYAPSDFASYLYWRNAGYPEAGVRDGFGSAIIRSVEGHVLLGRQARGNVNAGQAYLPGGFVDQQDVTPDCRIDIDGSVAREIREELGLDAAGGDTAQLQRSGGYLLSFAGALISIGVEFRSTLEAEALRSLILANISRQVSPELTDIVVMRRQPDIAAADVPAYTRNVLVALLPG